MLILLKNLKCCFRNNITPLCVSTAQCSACISPEKCHKHNLLIAVCCLLNISDLSNKRFKDKTQQGKIEFINNLMIAVHIARIPNSESDFN